jgi:hypothetical protein
MDSAPTAIPISIEPEMMESAIVFTAIKPEEQKRLTVCTGTVTGNPPAIAAVRASLLAYGGWTCPAYPYNKHYIRISLVKLPRSSWVGCD